jgi:hypothetical protein
MILVPIGPGPPSLQEFDHCSLSAIDYFLLEKTIYKQGCLVHLQAVRMRLRQGLLICEALPPPRHGRTGTRGFPGTQ